MAKSQHTTTIEDTAVVAAVRPDPCSTVVYVCAERGLHTPNLSADRAEAEGRAFAAVLGLRVDTVIRDPYGERDPLRREGWRNVRELAEAGVAATVIARWPAAIAPDVAHELRYREIEWLQARGVRVLYSWPPLTKGTGGVK